jgi:hypothetical protein
MNERLNALSDLIEESTARVRFGYPVWLRPFLQRNVIGITLGRRVFLSQQLLERSDEELQRIVRHELAHVRQVHQLGLLRFLWRYVREYLSLRRKGLSSSKAYAAISFEVEAVAAERTPPETGTPL